MDKNGRISSERVTAIAEALESAVRPHLSYDEYRHLEQCANCSCLTDYWNIVNGKTLCFSCDPTPAPTTAS